MSLMQQKASVDVEALMARIADLIDQGRPGAARPLLSAVRGLAAPSSEISVLAARLALSDGVLNETEADLDAAIVAAPEHPGLRKCRAELRRRAGDLEGAARDAAEAVVNDRDDPVAKALLGVSLHDIGRHADAVACLRESVRAVPRDPSYREALAQSLLAMGDGDAGLAVLLEGIALAPGATAIRNAATLLCIRRRDFKQAAQLAEDGRAAGAADAVTFGLKGHALSSLGRHEDATLAYEEALKLAPDDPYVRHLGAAAGIASTAPRAPDDYVRTLFDGYAERFESHLVSLGYRIPGLIRRQVIAFSGETEIGPVLDLGCGTGLAALAISDLKLGPVTGIDISPRMLAWAEAKGLYADLREGALPAALRDETRSWKLIIAADLMCYFGALDEMLEGVHAHLAPAGRFIFSVEELLPDQSGSVSSGGDWALGRMGRYAHAAPYITNVAAARGFRVRSVEREALRHEAGGPVAGLLIVLERPHADA
jgi:predicted TPR repeat methyltransferase